MVETSYHHGALRETLLTEGRQLLTEQGVDAVSLRELARRAGVSHAAPRRHFIDRDALLEAIAAQGFDDLTAALRDAARLDDRRARLTSYAHAHIAFARDNGPLMSLMFGTAGAPDGPLANAAARFFSLGAELLGESSDNGPGTLPYLVAGTFEGISGLVIAGRLAPGRVDAVVADAVEMLLPRLGPHRRPRARPRRQRSG